MQDAGRGIVEGDAVEFDANGPLQARANPPALPPASRRNPQVAQVKVLRIRCSGCASLGQLVGKAVGRLDVLTTEPAVMRGQSKRQDRSSPIRHGHHASSAEADLLADGQVEPLTPQHQRELSAVSQKAQTIQADSWQPPGSSARRDSGHVAWEFGGGAGRKSPAPLNMGYGDRNGAQGEQDSDG